MPIAEEVRSKLYPPRGVSEFQPGLVRGWNGGHPALRRLIAGPRPVVIDVGVWEGQSTFTMADEIRRRELDGVVIAVDTFCGSEELWDEVPRDPNGSPPHMRSVLFERLLMHAIHLGLAPFVVPMQMTSVAAAHILRSRGIQPTLVHIDASHDYNSVLLDAMTYWAFLEPGGILIGDDYDGSHLSVVTAVNVFSAAINRGIEVDEPKWIVRK